MTADVMAPDAAQASWETTLVKNMASQERAGIRAIRTRISADCAWDLAVVRRENGNQVFVLQESRPGDRVIAMWFDEEWR